MAETGISDVASTLSEKINSTIQSFLIQKSRLIPTVSKQMAPKGIKSVDLPKFGALTVNDKSENVAATLQELTSSNDQLLLDKEKIVAFAIEDRAKDQSVVDLSGTGLERASKGLALQMDKDIRDQLELASIAAPDHRLEYANSGTLNTLGQADIVKARELLHLQDIEEFRECYIGVNPTSEANLLLIDNFVHVDKYGANTATANGEIGKLYGAPVIMSNVFDEFKTVIWHPEHVAFAVQREMQMEKDRDILKLADVYAVHALYGAQVLDGGLRAVVLGTA